MLHLLCKVLTDSVSDEFIMKDSGITDQVDPIYCCIIRNRAQNQFKPQHYLRQLDVLVHTQTVLQGTCTKPNHNVQGMINAYLQYICTCKPWIN